jgi:hypothetical protein
MDVVVANIDTYLEKNLVVYLSLRENQKRWTIAHRGDWLAKMS